MLNGRRAAPLVAAYFTLVAGSAAAQTLSNPDISVIGDFRGILRPGDAADSLGTEKFSFLAEEVELALTGHLNPYMRADVFIGYHVSEEDIHVEEFNLTVLRGLPLSLQFNAGRYLLDFGRINSQHPHQWAWIERPLMQRTMLGEEGLRADGARVTTLIAIGGSALGLSASAFSSSAFAPEHEESGEEDAAPKIVGNARASLFSQLSETWSAEVGASYLGGTRDPAQDLRVKLGGVDAKVRWRPDAYRSFVWVLEAMASDRDVAAEDSVSLSVSNVDARGAFTSAGLQWRKRWDAGGFFDWSEDATIEDAATTAAGAWLAFSPVEETARISLVYRHETSDLYEFTDHSVTVQFLWSLGPHRPHTF